MPGILPMKVIRVGTSAQSRIAQACDRCRSKKIRCDGIRPQCTQCANVGFECKTSDKLSRRAFPRGYTESLEDRVRALEAEVRELKDLLDEKDEKIDVLSRIHSFSSPSRKCSASLSPPVSDDVKRNLEIVEEEFVQIETQVSAAPSNPPCSQSCTSALIGTYHFLWWPSRVLMCQMRLLARSASPESHTQRSECKHSTHNSSLRLHHLALQILRLVSRLVCYRTSISTYSSKNGHPSFPSSIVLPSCASMSNI